MPSLTDAALAPLTSLEGLAVENLTGDGVRFTADTIADLRRLRLVALFFCPTIDVVRLLAAVPTGCNVVVW